MDFLNIQKNIKDFSEKEDFSTACLKLKEKINSITTYINQLDNYDEYR